MALWGTSEGTQIEGHVSVTTNDATVTVDSVNTTGYTDQGIIQTASVSGTAPTLPTSFTGIAGSNARQPGPAAGVRRRSSWRLGRASWTCSRRYTNARRARRSGR
mgnify:CR=1 FL=1